MFQERFGAIKFKGKDATVVGTDLLPGDPAPEFTVQNLEWADFKGLGDTQGKVRIITSLPSLETDVCDRETRRFNQEAAALDKDIVIMAVSNDLPYTQKRWCAAAGVSQVVVLSDHKYGDFGNKYAVLIKEPGVLRRAAFVVDRNGKLTYVAYMPVLGEEPNYDEVLAAAQAALKS
jgi:thioredoxin-dependent peroxiredoxin